MKRLVAILLIFMLVLTAFPAIAGTGSAKIDVLIEEGYVRGDNGGYRLKDYIRRSEISAMISRMTESEDIADVLISIQSRFKDVPTNSWFNGYVNFTDAMGYIEGYPDRTFRPLNNITYAEIIKILVMVNGEKPLAEGYETSLWYIPYILKAIEVGILDGIVIPEGNYNLPATREKVFEMVYNTISGKILTEREIYDVLITGNSRTLGLRDNQLEAVVLDNTENVRKANPRFRIGNKFTLEFENLVEQEDFLGKAMRVTIDRENNVVDYEEDSSFEYYTGPFLAEEDRIMLGNGNHYSVSLGRTTADSTGRLYAFYHNDFKYNYLDFLNEFDVIDGAADGAYIPEYGRVTIKDGKVVFIDSYDFDDIAPVYSIEDEGKTIKILDDKADGAIKNVTLDSIYGVYRGRFVKLGIREIFEEDVLHIYGNNAIVRLDGVYSGEFLGIDDSTSATYALVSGEYFQIRETNGKRPVYSLNSEEFDTIYGLEDYYEMDKLIEQRIIFIIDLNESLQMISIYY